MGSYTQLERRCEKGKTVKAARELRRAMNGLTPPASHIPSSNPREPGSAITEPSPLVQDPPPRRRGGGDEGRLGLMVATCVYPSC